MNTIPSFIGTLGLVDCAARAFGEEHPARRDPADAGTTPEARTFARSYAVAALRSAWLACDASERAMLAIRVKLWTLPRGQCDYGPRWKALAYSLGGRIEARERARLTGGAS